MKIFFVSKFRQCVWLAFISVIPFFLLIPLLYTGLVFSERMVIDQPVKGMDFANDMIQMYFMMSLRYRECYYKQRPQGNTVYFMNYPEASLLFYFAAGMRSYRVNGFRIEKEERRKAWN